MVDFHNMQSLLEHQNKIRIWISGDHPGLATIWSAARLNASLCLLYFT